ncbi:MAG TPA: hypothetical protein V6D02_00360 [Candidatus Obscuribacterales bacterium]
MAQRNWMTIAGLCLGGAIALLPAAAIARPCERLPATPPSATLREFRVADYDLAVLIPDNYRSMLRSSGHITFHDPASFELIQCSARTGSYGEVPPYVTLEVHPGANAAANLVAVVRVKRPWVDYYNPAYTPGVFAGRAAVRYDYTQDISRLAIANISFLAPNGQTLLTLTGPANHPILQQAIAQLQPEPPPLAAPEPSTPEPFIPDPFIPEPPVLEPAPAAL